MVIRGTIFNCYHIKVPRKIILGILYLAVKPQNGRIMKNIFLFLCTISLSGQLQCQYKIADPSDYLNDIKKELLKEWPDNRNNNYFVPH